jgi:UDP-glucuronate 4-epimerase
MNFLVTGSHGFIGFHLVNFLTSKGYTVYGIDNLSSTSKKTQKLRTNILKKNKNFIFHNIDLKNKIRKNLTKNKIDLIIHLAAQPGVRLSQLRPNQTFENNIKGYINLLEFAKKKNIKNIFYASSSSVYGNSNNFKEKILVGNSLTSVYAISKLTTELISNVYNRLFKINFVGLRFFTVYGNYGREDMAYYKFLNQIVKNKKITIYGKKNFRRSFTCVNDVILCIYKLLLFFNKKNKFNYIFNIGNPNEISLRKMISIIKLNFPLKFRETYLKEDLSDVDTTKSNMELFSKKISKIKFVTFNDGYNKIIDWYCIHILKRKK